jgi:hypothetical protein
VCPCQRALSPVKFYRYDHNVFPGKETCFTG